jgi:hypothetical protein
VVNGGTEVKGSARHGSTNGLRAKAIRIVNIAGRDADPLFAVGSEIGALGLRAGSVRKSLVSRRAVRCRRVGTATLRAVAVLEADSLVFLIETTDVSLQREVIARVVSIDLDLEDFGVTLLVEVAA